MNKNNKKNKAWHKYLPIGKRRWYAYWTQINYVNKIKPAKILEIGPGRGVVTDYLKKANINIITCDPDPAVNTDINYSFKQIQDKNIADLVICCEVLEHMPFNEFSSNLNKLHTLTSKYVLLSLPQKYFLLTFNIILHNILNLKFVSIKPPYLRPHKWDGQHYWEINSKNYPETKIRNKIKKADFKIIEEKTFPENPYNRFYLLEAKSN